MIDIALILAFLCLLLLVWFLTQPLFAQRSPARDSQPRDISPPTPPTPFSDRTPPPSPPPTVAPDISGVDDEGDPISRSPLPETVTPAVPPVVSSSDQSSGQNSMVGEESPPAHEIPAPSALMPGVIVSPQASPPPIATDIKSLHNVLLELVKGDRTVAERLVVQARSKYPDQPLVELYDRLILEQLSNEQLISEFSVESNQFTPEFSTLDSPLEVSSHGGFSNGQLKLPPSTDSTSPGSLLNSQPTQLQTQPIQTQPTHLQPPTSPPSSVDSPATELQPEFIQLQQPPTSPHSLVDSPTTELQAQSTHLQLPTSPHPSLDAESTHLQPSPTSTPILENPLENPGEVQQDSPTATAASSAFSAEVENSNPENSNSENSNLVDCNFENANSTNASSVNSKAQLNSRSSLAARIEDLVSPDEWSSAPAAQYHSPAPPLHHRYGKAPSSASPISAQNDCVGHPQPSVASGSLDLTFSAPQPSIEQDRDIQQLHSRLLDLVGGDRAVAKRLLVYVGYRHSDKPLSWVYEKVIFDLERDRR